MRVWKVKSALQCAGSGVYLTSLQLSVLIGAYVSLCLTTRGGMGVPRACYTFIDKGISVPSFVWPSVKYELAVIFYL